jgi:hypothetical protein
VVAVTNMLADLAEVPELGLDATVTLTDWRVRVDRAADPDIPSGDLSRQDGALRKLLTSSIPVVSARQRRVLLELASDSLLPGERCRAVRVQQRFNALLLWVARSGDPAEVELRMTALEQHVLNLGPLLAQLRYRRRWVTRAHRRARHRITTIMITDDAERLYRLLATDGPSYRSRYPELTHTLLREHGDRETPGLTEEEAAQIVDGLPVIPAADDVCPCGGSEDGCPPPG